MAGEARDPSPPSPTLIQVLTTATVGSDTSTSSYRSSWQSRLGRPSMYVLGSENFLCISLEDIHGCKKLPGTHRTHWHTSLKECRIKALGYTTQT